MILTDQLAGDEPSKFSGKDAETLLNCWFSNYSNWWFRITTMMQRHPLWLVVSTRRRRRSLRLGSVLPESDEEMLVLRPLKALRMKSLASICDGGGDRPT